MATGGQTLLLWIGTEVTTEEAIAGDRRDNRWRRCMSEAEAETEAEETIAGAESDETIAEAEENRWRRV